MQKHFQNNVTNVSHCLKDFFKNLQQFENENFIETFNIYLYIIV